jgi:hypothetical protein
MLDYMNELKSKCQQKGGDYQAELQETLKGTTVVTR